MKTSINLYDHSNKLFVRIKKSKDASLWNRFVSKNKKSWKLTHSTPSLEDVLKYKEEVINNNFRNLFKVLTKK